MNFYREGDRVLVRCKNDPTRYKAAYVIKINASGMQVRYVDQDEMERLTAKDYVRLFCLLKMSTPRGGFFDLSQTKNLVKSSKSLVEERLLNNTSIKISYQTVGQALEYMRGALDYCGNHFRVEPTLARAFSRGSTSVTKGKLKKHFTALRKAFWEKIVMSLPGTLNASTSRVAIILSDEDLLEYVLDYLTSKEENIETARARMYARHQNMDRIIARHFNNKRIGERLIPTNRS